MSRKIRIGQILTNIHDGGIERVVLQVACGLPDARFETRVYALIDENPWIEVFRSRGIPVEVIGASNRPGWRGFPGNVRALLKLARLLRRDRIDVASTHDFFPATFGRLASLLAGVPHRVTTLHNTYTWFRWPHHAVNRLLACWTDSVIAVSAAALEYSRTHDRLQEELYQLIPNGVDLPEPAPDARAEVRRELGIPEDAFVVGNVGTHSVRKGQRYLLEAASQLTSTHPQLHIVIVGSARAHEQEISKHLHDLAATPSLAGRVHFLENRHDMHRLYRSFDLFCMPSIAEGLSLASIEAMMAGCASLFSDIGPFQEIAQADKDALFFPQGSVPALVQALARALHQPQGLQSLRDRAKQHSRATYGASSMIIKYANLLDQIRRRSLA